MNRVEQTHKARTDVRRFADRAFSRAAGAALIEGNSIRLLKNAAQNYPAWLDAIGAARHHVCFENYIISEDVVGERFAEAFIRKAREGVSVRVIYDWLGSFGRASSRFWNRLQSGGVQVRCYNPPRLDSPFGWLSRDHRKMLSVDSQVGFITGLCVGRAWEGVPEKNLEPWRDTGVQVRGPAVAEIEAAFDQVWAMTGEAAKPEAATDSRVLAEAGDVAMRIVASAPATAGMFRLDQLIAALARERLWMTDAYYAGTPSYVEGLRAAARDGVDVRLLVPNATDIPVLRPLSRSGYRPLLEGGVRLFEWNGTMLHAKTAVADGRWARVGSTNLNLASWFGNLELDAVVEDEAFAREMEQMYIEDLANSTEVVLDARRRVRAPGEPHPVQRRLASGRGSTGRAAAGAVRFGNAVGAAMSSRRALEPVETRMLIPAALLLLGLSAVLARFPFLLIYPLLFILIWLAAALLYKGFRAYRAARRARSTQSGERTAA